MRIYLVGVLAVFLAGSALGQGETSSTPAPPEHQIILPDWKRVPDAPTVGSVYPARARELNVTGTTTMLCRVTRKGRLKDCRTLSESPQNFGFGAAELALAAYFEMTPKRIDGKPVEAEITVPMRFDLN